MATDLISGGGGTAGWETFVPRGGGILKFAYDDENAYEYSLMNTKHILVTGNQKNAYEPKIWWILIIFIKKTHMNQKYDEY